ncbi:MAG: putative molybdenum carrier protein [Coriobacteriales bacterium]|jgi:hypothetical protein|nr:putative molybdenum carrier protein [Coriobacteriales bacterium]
MSKIKTIRSGAQTGVDRGALDAAKSLGVPICGWCPKGGLAEDFPEPPGLLEQYPELVETPTSDYYERTAWNVRDSDATLVLFPHDLKRSVGTEYTIDIASEYKKPCLVLEHVDVVAALAWLDTLGDELDLNVAGPRLRNYDGIDTMAFELIAGILKAFPLSS